MTYYLLSIFGSTSIWNTETPTCRCKSGYEMTWLQQIKKHLEDRKFHEIDERTSL